jgi:hypothetical protein
VEETITMVVEAAMETMMVEGVVVTVEDIITRIAVAEGVVAAIGLVGVLVDTMPTIVGVVITIMAVMIEEATTIPIRREHLLP